MEKEKAKFMFIYLRTFAAIVFGLLFHGVFESAFTKANIFYIVMQRAFKIYDMN